jgi:threonyl-tRNA synthetase
VKKNPRKVVEFLEKIDQPFKIELAKEFAADGQAITFYRNVDKAGETKFIDLCRGGHLDSTSEIGAFKLNKIAAAYWRGNEKNPQLQRIYGLCFEKEEELTAHLKMLEEAEKRDHRKLGRELDLYMISEEVGAGLPLWLPNGAILVEEIEKLAKQVSSTAAINVCERPTSPRVLCTTSRDTFLTMRSLCSLP